MLHGGTEVNFPATLSEKKDPNGYLEMQQLPTENLLQLFFFYHNHFANIGVKHALNKTY